MLSAILTQWTQQVRAQRRVVLIRQLLFDSHVVVQLALDPVSCQFRYSMTVDGLGETGWSKTGLDVKVQYGTCLICGQCSCQMAQS